MENQQQSDNVQFFDILETILGAVLVESLLYGVHLVLFCICFYILFKRRNPAQLVILLAITIMFALATADVAVSYRFILHDTPKVLRHELDVDDVINHITPKNQLFVTSNLIADGLLLYRCFMIWNGRKYLFLIPATLLIADSVWGYVSQTPSTLPVAIAFSFLFFWSIFAFNIVMTIATAGRIWWIARGAGPILGRQHIQRYNTAIAIIIESGVIYSISVLLCLILVPGHLIFILVTFRVVGIMPTLMIVQVEMRRNLQEKPNTNQVETNKASLWVSLPVVPATLFPPNSPDPCIPRANNDTMV